jgi:Ca2+-binding EF-hand superfamily protein
MIFKGVDIDADGSISLEEFKPLLANIMNDLYEKLL